MQSPDFRLCARCSALLMLFFCATSTAQDDQEASLPESAPLFASHAPLAVTIAAPFSTLMTERNDEDYLEGTFSYAEHGGEPSTLDLKLRARGNFRLNPEICEFGPIRLNFSKKQVEGTLFEGQDKLKLVTHCDNNNPAYEQYALREYFAYRALSLLTPASFSVRLMEITYVDTDREGRARTKYGFVIEDDDDLAARLGMESMKIGDVEHEQLEPLQQNLVNVFAWFIGNTDYSLIRGAPGDDCCHNSVLLSATGGPPFTPVPYDFDASGIVNAPYAAPNPNFAIRNVRQRLYRGQCENNALLPGTLGRFLEERTEFYEVLDSIEALSGRSKKYLDRYMDSFFRHITDQTQIDRNLLGACL